MKRLLYIKMFIALLLVFGFIGCQKFSDIASNSIGFDTVSVIGSNEICQIAARMVCFDKNTILAYYNTEIQIAYFMHTNINRVDIYLLITSWIILTKYQFHHPFH